MAAVRADVEVRLDRRSQARVESELNSMFRRMSGRNAGFSINDKSFTQPLGRITASANEFTKSLEASNARVIAFGASVGVINAVTDAFKGLVMETIQFEKTLSEINVIMNSSASALRNFGDELFNVARNTAQGFNVVAEAALEFSRQGLTMEETLRRTNDALILTRLTSLKATEAVSGLTAAVNAFGSAGLTTTQIIDKLAAVDVNFAVSSEDLIHALERTGAVAISAGVELDNLIGLVTALQQNTARGGSVIGNGLKTIFTRIQRPASLRQLEEMDIAVRDLTGAVLPADKILQNIAKTFDTLSQAQQSNLVQFSAGIFQANIFRATLADLAKQQNIFSDASKISADAAGNAAVKNAALNKTLAAMVSQTSSSVRELAGALGEIMLEDDLKNWTKGFKSLVDGLTGALDSGEGKGSDFAKGFFKGLGNVLTGPVAIAIGVVFVKLLANVAKFAGQSLKDVLGVTSEKEKLLKMENGIIEALSRNKHIQQALNNLEGDRLAQEEFMLKTIEAQTNAMQAQKRLAQSLARPLMNRGINPDMTAANVPGGGAPIDLNGDGRYDTFTAGGLIPKAVIKERQGAIKGGYNPGAVSTMNIDGLGSVVYNKAETVKRFPGFKQPAIMPPESSRAGQEYKGRFAKQHGFNPYASHGLVPNFASIQNDASNMRLMGTGQLKAPMYIERQIRGSTVGEPMSLNIKTKASGLKGKNWKRHKDGISLGELLVALGIDSIDTTMPFDFVPGTVGPLRKLPKGIRNVLTDPNNDAKGDGTESIFLSSQAGKGYTSTGGITPLDDEGAYSVDRSIRAPNANLDAYKIGGLPTEVKAGDLDLNGVVKKSIRRFSNTSFRNSARNIANDFLYDDRPNAMFPDMTNNEVAEELIHTVNHLQEEFIIERLSELAKNGNWSPVGMSREQLTSLIQTNKLREHLRNSGFSASDTDKELLNSIGFSAGFIPNFGRGRPSGTSKINYKELSDIILSYPGSLPTYEDLAAETGFKQETFAQLGARGIPGFPNQTKKAFINHYMNIKDHMGSGASVYTKEQAKGILSDVHDKLKSTRKKGYVQNLGLVFEDNLRNHLEVPKPGGQPHMDFHKDELSGVDPVKADEIFLSTKTGGDAYKGQKGHPEPHFIAKYFREKLGPGGKKIYNLNTDIGKKLGNFAIGDDSNISFNNMGQYNDIVGVKDADREDQPIQGDAKLSEVFNYAKGLRDQIRSKFGKIKKPSQKFVKFNYIKDYVTAMSGGFIPNYKNFYQMFYGNDSKPAGMDIGHKVGARENWGHHHEYILSEAEADDMLKEEFSRRGKLAAKSPNPQEYMQRLFNTGIGNMYTRKYSMDDSDYAQLSSGIYSDSNATILSKILTGLPWTDGKSNRRSALGTKLMPFKLATIRSFPHIPFNGRNALTFPDVFANNKAGIPPELDSKNIWSTSEKLNKTFMKDMGMEQETIEEYFDEKDFIKLLAKSAGDKEPEAMKAGRQGGIQGVKDFMDGMYAGYIPNFLTFKERKGGGSPIPVPDSPGLFSKEEVEELKAKGFQRNDSDGWFKADPVPLKYKSPTHFAPFSKAEPVSINYLNKLIRHDRSLYSIPNAQDDNADLDQLGKSLTQEQKNPAIIGYDSSQNKLQLIEGNHRVAALNKLNKDKLKTQKMYSGLHAYVTGIALDDVRNIDFGVGLVNQRMPPRKIPEDIQEALKDPYRGHGQFVQGFWRPSEFGIPNFADFWDNPYFKNKQKTIIDKPTGTSLKYRTLTPDYAEITHAVRGEKDIKGGAFRNFNTLMSKYDSVGSGMLTPQRAGFGPTSWAKIVTMFPQIKQRIQPGLRTLGDFAIDDTEIDFESLVQLKKKTNRFFKDDPNADTFLTNFGNGPFFDDAVSFQNLTTYKVKGKGDSAAGFKARGLVPNFASIRWNVDKATNKWALSGNQFDLDSFARYLQEVSLKDPKMVNPKSANKFAERVERLSAVMAKEREEVHKNTPIGFGRQGRKHYDQMAFVSERSRDVSTDGLFIKNLKNHVKQFNKHGALFAADRIGGYDSFVNSGLVPNFYNLNRRNLSDGDKMSDRQKLLMMWQNKMAEVKQLAQSGKPRAEIDPIISKKNAEANEIWGELQKLKQGSNYYIPNYVDLEKVRQLAIRGVGGEKENAQRILDKRSIKSKNMFHDIIIDSFLDNPNQDYPNPGTSIIDYLIKSPPDGLGYDEDLIRSAAKNPKGYRRAAKGLIPNFENVHLKRGQTDPNAPLLQPNINKILFEPLLSAQTPEDMYKRVLSFMQAHATGILSGRSSKGTTGDLGNKLADYITRHYMTTDGKSKFWDESNDPYTGEWISEELGKNVDPTGFLDMASGAVSYTTRDAIADQFHKSKLHGGKAKGKIHEVTVPKKNIFGKKKLLRMLNMGARPPKYPMLDKVKNAIRDGSFFKFWQDKGGLFINIDGDRNDRSLIDLDKQLNELRPELGRGEVRTSMFYRRMPSIAPHIDRKSGDFYAENEVTRVVNHGLVPNFSRIERIRESQKDRVRGEGMFLGSGPSEVDKKVAEQLFDYIISSISGLSGIFRYDPATMSFRGNSEDFTKIFRHSKSLNNRNKMAEIAGGEVRLRKILNDYLLGHTSAILEARGRYEIGKDPLMGAASLGLIPSFSNPLRDAINREKAAGIPASMIRIDRSSQLMGPQNPMGLAVINTRDEPGGVQQGINRSRAMGIDPKKHGLQVPNFADREFDPKIQQILQDFVAQEISDGIQRALESAANVQTAGSEMKNLDFGKAGLGSIDPDDFRYGGDVIDQNTRGGDTAIAADTADQMRSKVSSDKLTAEGERDKILQNRQGGSAEAEKLQELDKIIAGLESLESALDEHANSMSGDTREYIQELAKASGGIKDVNKEQIKSTAKGGFGPKIENALEQARKDPNRLRSAADQARAKLSKDEEAWKKATGADKAKALDDMEATRKQVLSLKASEDAIAREAKAREGGLQKLFYFQSMISMTNGFLQQMSETGAGATKALADVGLAASNIFAASLQAKELGQEALEAAGVAQGEGYSLKNLFSGAGAQKRAEADQEAQNRVAMGTGGFIDRMRFSTRGQDPKSGLMDKALGGLSRSFGGASRAVTRMIPVVGQLYTGFTAIDEGLKGLSKTDWGQSMLKSFGLELEKGEGIMALFKSNSERAAASIERLTKASDVAAKALEAVESSGARNIKIVELESKGRGRTLKQDRELHKLKMEELKATNNLIQVRSQLQDKDIVGAEVAAEMTNQFKSVNMTGRNTEEVLRKLNATLQKQIVLQQSRKSFNEQIEEDFDFTNWEGIIGGLISPGLLAAAPFMAKGAAITAGVGGVGGMTSGAGAGMAQTTLGQDEGDFRDMRLAMESRADTLFGEYLQGLQGGDTDASGRVRSDAEKQQSLQNNMEVFLKAANANLKEGPEAMKLIFQQLEGSSAFGEQSTDQLIKAFSDYVDSGADMQDNIFKEFLSQEGQATVGGLNIVAARMKKAADEKKEDISAKDKALIDMRTIRLQERIFRNYEIQLDRTMHNLKIMDKQITVDQEIQGIKEDLLSEYGLMLNSTKIENDHARKTASRQRQHEIKTNEIRQKLDREATKILEEQVKLQNLPGIVTKQEGSSAGEQFAKYAKQLSQGKNVELGPETTALKIQDRFMQTMSDSGMGAMGEQLFEEAKKFIGQFGEQVKTIDDAGQAATLFQESVLDVADVNKKYAISVLAEMAQLVDSGDAGKARRALIKTFAGGMRDLEAANNDLALETKKSAEELRNRRIKENTLLGAGLLSKQMSENNDIENQPGIINKTLEGEAASQSVRNKINKDRIETLLKSKNFEMKILANLEAESVKSAESSVTSLKNSQIKNQIFSKNQDILISSISKAMLEQEELAISNKEKEVKLATLTNSERLKSFAEESVKSEILDAEINARITEAKRKVLENAGYARMLAEAQVKAETESAKISAINAEQKLAAQIANGSISELVKSELESKLSSTRTEALKASESAIQLQLNKEQTKKMQKANDLLELSNKFAEMKNAEMLANRGGRIIRMNNQMQRGTDQFNMIAGARSAIDMAAMTGNADDKAAAASQIADVERSITGRSGALTMLAQKMAEVEVAASSLSADLAGTLFDGVKSGFGTLLTDIATGAETAGEAWEKFGLGVAKQLLDRVMEHNIDKMMGNLTYALTGVKNDPAGQQKLLANATSKQTNAIKKLTEKIEALRRGLSGDINAESGGKGGGPLASIDYNKISELMSRMGSNAGNAADGLAQLESKALKLANFFEGDYTRGITDANKQISQYSKNIAESKNLEARRGRTEKNINEIKNSLKAVKGIRGRREKEKIEAQESHEKLKKKFGSGKLTDKDIDKMISSQLTNEQTGIHSGQFRYQAAMGEVDKLAAIKKYEKDFQELSKQQQVALQEQVRARMPMIKQEEFVGTISMRSMKYDPNSETFGYQKPNSGEFTAPGAHNFMLADSGDFFQHHDEAKPKYKEDKGRLMDFDGRKSDAFNQGPLELSFGSAIGLNDLKPTSAGEEFAEQLKELKKSKNNLSDKTLELERVNQEEANLESRLKIQSEVYEEQVRKINSHNEAVQKSKEAILGFERVIAGLNSKLESLSGPKLPEKPSKVKIKDEFFGGKIQNFHDGGFVRGEPGRDKVPAMLTAGEYVIPKDMMQAFKKGGEAKENRFVAGLKGSAEAVTMTLVANEVADAVNGEPEDKPPTFDMKKLNTVDIGSDVNIGRGDPRMSARALAKDPVMKEYKDYLLKKAAYDVQKKNEKFQERMGILGTVVGAISSFAISQATDLLKEPINNLVTKGDNFLRGTMELGQHSDKFKHDSFPEGFDYKDINQKGKRFTVGTGKNKHKWVKDQWVPIKKAMGGQIPAMLTAGEMYVPAEMAKRIGYDSLDKINKSGIIDGPGGIDNVGPVGLNPGDFIIRKSSTDKLLNTNPNGMRDSLMGGGFTRRAATGYYEGGMAGETATVPVQSFSPRRSNFDTSVSSIADQEISSTQERTTSQGSSATTNNINISVKIDSSGRETVESSAEGEGSYQREKDLSMKIKSAVLEVIRQEKRVGGELS